MLFQFGQLASAKNLDKVEQTQVQCLKRMVLRHILQSLNDWTQNLQDGYQTVIINVNFSNFSKAFDVVQHDKLLVR